MNKQKQAIALKERDSKINREVFAWVIIAGIAVAIYTAIHLIPAFSNHLTR